MDTSTIKTLALTNHLHQVSIYMNTEYKECGETNSIHTVNYNFIINLNALYKLSVYNFVIIHVIIFMMLMYLLLHQTQGQNNF